ncbi:MAG: tetratricopeptide repeat protein [Endomicrobiaceae bacterium]|jgi:putative inorganic carbon (HCO3(-)) transporter|nr:tetratricopeptide repeat protein [Endomicrobiaceae bacterium]MDD3730442.1 tetratricopeptide repeat protein [Endomicrobiaceae bacterium]MDD4166296.1 tetratricopeptide repeat protein [Endomicrobiaceae bacterium]
MLSDIIKKTFSKILQYGVPLFYFLVAVSFYLGTYDSAQIKITIVQIGGIFLICSWLILKFEEDLFPTLRQNPVVAAPVLLFLVSGLISYLFSYFNYASLNEFSRRLIYCLLALIIADFFNEKKSINRLINFLISATYIVCIYSVIQFIDINFFPPPPDKGLDPFAWRQAFGPKIFSTFGNPNFLGDFLVVMSPITLALFFKKRKFHLLFLWILITFSTVVTYSKGAWIGYGLGLLTFGFLFVNFILHIEKSKRIFILIIMSFLTVTTVSGAIFIQMKKRPDSASFRTCTWLATWEMINTNPVLGTGIGTFYLTYPSFRRPEIFFIEGAHNTETDHAENEYLEVFYDEGIIGIGIFLALLALFLTLGLKNLAYFRKRNLNDGTMAYIQLGVLSALVAQLGHNLVCVSLRFVSSGVMLWMLIGLTAAISFQYIKKEKIDIVVFPSVIKRIMQIIIFLMMCYLIFVFYGFFQADKTHATAIYYSKQGRWNESLEYFDKTIRKNPSFIMPRYFKANNYNDRFQNDDVSKALAEYESLWKLAPNYVQSKFLVGALYTKLWAEYNLQYNGFLAKKDEKNAETALKNRDDSFQKAVRYYNEYELIDPIFPETYYRLAWLYVQNGEYQKALDEYQKHLDAPGKLIRNADYWKPRRKNEYAFTYINMGSLYFMMNNLDKAEECFKKSLELVPDSLEGLKSLVALYNKTNRKDEFNKTVETLKKLYPQDKVVSTLVLKK